MASIRDTLNSTWSVTEGVIDDDSIITWVIYSDVDGRTICETESKMVADHIAKLHNRKIRK